MFRGIEAKSCARAWLAACKSIMATRNEGYNVIMDVADPVKHDAKDNAAISLVDKFLKEHSESPIVTVANTIFPQALCEAHGAPEFYKIYHRDFDRFSRDAKGWGQYFDRMTRWKIAGGDTIYPLQDLIAKLKNNQAKNRRVKAVYEVAVTGPSLAATDAPEVEEEDSDLDLTIYAPDRDRKKPISGPCLSYLSFKRHIDGDLLLTAVYRNHYYMTKLLGNLIGLGQLQAFVAKEAGLKAGSLTIVSTHAEIDMEGGWKTGDVKDLVDQVARMLQD
jgi:thymidylate synthase